MISFASLLQSWRNQIHFWWKHDLLQVIWQHAGWNFLSPLHPLHSQWMKNSYLFLLWQCLLQNVNLLFFPFLFSLFSRGDKHVSTRASVVHMLWKDRLPCSTFGWQCLKTLLHLVTKLAENTFRWHHSELENPCLH